MISLRLVVDTNIVVSAALKPDGLQRTVLLLAITKRRDYISRKPSSRNIVKYWRARNYRFERASSANC
jgi:predicted nucleic acid-binding protein